MNENDIYTMLQGDDNLREAVRRHEQKQPPMPADLSERLMQRMEETLPHREGRIRSFPFWGRLVGAAACLLVIVGVGFALLHKEEPAKSEQMMVKRAKPVSVPKYAAAPKQNPIKPLPSVSSPVGMGKKEASPTGGGLEGAPTGDLEETPTGGLEGGVNDPNVLYAAHAPEEDTVSYQSPARMDEFIAEMAAFNKVEAVPLECSSGNSDLAVVSTAYVFEDDQEFHLFARLLQAACWYDSQTPGYLLNFSHQQFFFTLKDMRRKEKYLWIAERIGGNRILLYATHSPTEANVSSECFQKYREQLTLIKHNL